MAFFHNALSQFIANWGYLTVFVMLAVEGFGLFFVPGETTLITAAIYAGATGALNIFVLLVVAFGGAITGDNFAYGVGRRFGFGLLRRHGDKIHLDNRRVKFIQYLYLRYGIPIVFVGRFVMLLRSWESFLAGANTFPWRRFFSANAMASAVWVCAWGGGSYLLGVEAKHDLMWISIGIFIVIVILIATGGIYFRRHEEEFEDRADKALPGKLQAHNPEDLKIDGIGSQAQAPATPFPTIDPGSTA